LSSSTGAADTCVQPGNFAKSRILGYTPVGDVHSSSPNAFAAPEGIVPIARPNSRTTPQKTILLVEDDAIIAMDQANVLEHSGYTVRTVHSAEAAVEAAKAAAVDLVLMDVDLGHGQEDGTEAARRILAERDVPIVFLSNHTEPEVMAKAEAITSYGYVVKNSGDTVLLASIRMAFRLREAHEERARKSRQLNTLLNNADDLICRLDRNKAFLYANRAMCEATGIPFEGIVGRTPKELGFPDELERECTRMLNTVLRTGEPARGEVRVALGGKDVVLDCRMVPELVEDGTVQTVVAVSRDVTEQARISEALRASESQKNVILNAMTELVAYYDTDLKILWTNSASAQSFGKRPQELVGRHCYEVWDQRESPCPDCPVLRAGVERTPQHGQRQTPDGRWWSLRGYPVLDEEGELVGLVEFGQDVSEQKAMDDRFRESLKQKDALMAELNHRVKNNLAMISSLVSLKNAAVGSSIDLSDIAHQIDAIRIIHEKLHQTGSVRWINLHDYAQDLVGTVFSSFSSAPVHAEVRIPRIHVLTRSAVALGLIINELATNAIQHGFVPGEQACFSVTLANGESDGTFVLTVSNNGRPFPSDVSLDHPATLGMRLIGALAKQLEGSLELRREPVPVFTLRLHMAVRDETGK
jgi:PAS domain S-box-containing protein